MIPPNLLNLTVSVRRRNIVGRDSLNNPVYGTPTSGSGWVTVIEGLQVRLAFTGKDVRFAPDGERIEPSGTMYYNDDVTLKQEDRIITPEGIEYNVIGINHGYLFGNVISHHECKLQLP